MRRSQEQEHGTAPETMNNCQSIDLILDTHARSLFWYCFLHYNVINIHIISDFQLGVLRDDMLRLLMYVLGVAFVAIAALPGVSLGEHAKHGFQSITVPYRPAESGPIHGGPVRAPQAPEWDPQAAAKSSSDAYDSVDTQRAHRNARVSVARATHVQTADQPIQTDHISPRVEPQVETAPSMPQVLGSVLSRAFPDRKRRRVVPSDTDRSASATPSPSAPDASVTAPPAAENETTSISAIPTNNQSKYKYLEIEVGYDTFMFKLYGVYESGQKDLLKECRVALGARGEGFDTPVGVYFVTHIYDEEPWWIPPPDRSWAWGQSASKRVYGGTMAPLLKKRPVSHRNAGANGGDYIEGQVKLDDNGYRFHGTNQPRSIGHRASHGCVRMLPKDAGEVASLIKQYVGAPEEGKSENGKYIVLRAPVRLTIVK